MAGIDSIVGMTPLGCDPIHGFASPGKGEDITGAAVVPHELVPHDNILDHLDGTVIHEYRSVTTEALTSTTLELDNTSPGMIGGGGGGGREGGGMFRGMFRRWGRETEVVEVRLDDFLLVIPEWFFKGAVDGGDFGEVNILTEGGETVAFDPVEPGDIDFVGVFAVDGEGGRGVVAGDGAVLGGDHIQLLVEGLEVRGGEDRFGDGVALFTDIRLGADRFTVGVGQGPGGGGGGRRGSGGLGGGGLGSGGGAVTGTSSHGGVDMGVVGIGYG